MADQEDFPNIYIDESVSPGGVGSEADPYSDFSEINWSASGDNSITDYYAGTPTASVIINLQKGEEWRETLTVGASGTATYVLTIQAYGSGADPIINGADIVATWSDEGSNIWSATLTTEPSQIFFDGTKGTEDATPDAEFDWYWDTNVLYYYSTTDPDSAYTEVEASVRTNCILSDNKDYITYTDLHIKYANNRNVRFQNGSTYNDVNTVEVEYSYLDGIYIDGAATGYNTVQYSDIHNNGTFISGIGEYIGCGILVTAASANNTLTYNDSYANAEDGIAVGGDETAGEGGVGGIDNTISHNNLYSNLEDGLDMKQGPQIVEYNDIYSNAANGMWIHNFAEYVIVRYNKFRDNTSHGVRIGGDSESQSSSDDAHQFYYNLVYDNGGSAFLAGGSGHELDSMTVYNNVFYDNDGQYGDFRYIGDELTLKNNIFVTITGGYCVRIENWTSMTIDYNSYDNSGGSVFYDRVNTTMYSETDVDDETLYSALGFEQNGIVGDPVFVDVDNDDFNFQSSSPCIDTGTDVSLTQDYDGKTVPYNNIPDIGAYEYEETALEINVELKRA